MRTAASAADDGGTDFGYAKCTGVRPSRSSIRRTDVSSSDAMPSGSSRSSSAWVWVCEPTVISPVLGRVPQAGPGEGRRAVGEGPLLLDERGREVHGRRDAVGGEDRERGVDEVGRPVVEGEDDRVVTGRSRVGEPGERVVECRHPPRGRELAHLGIEHGGGEVELEAGPGADAVVDEHDDARIGMADAIDRRRRRLQGATDETTRASVPTRES